MKGFWTVVKEVIKKSDIVLEILDARMPELTRTEKLEEMATRYGKPLILVINKSDLIRRPALKEIQELYKDQQYAIVSCKEGKGFSKLLSMIQTIQKDAKVAAIGYPNTGKSSIINRFSKGGKTKTSSESGYTKGYQYIAGKQGLKLIDTPGVVPYEARDEERLGLISGISPAKLQDPDVVAAKLLDLFKRNNPRVLEKLNLNPEEDSYDLLEQFGRNNHMLMKGGEIDIDRAAVKLLNEWHKGTFRI